MFLNRITKAHMLLTALMLSVLLYMSCSRQPNVPPSPFPASNEVAGWTKTGDIRSFSATELWNYIDGDAERYVKAGIQTTNTADYKFRDQFEAVVDIYTMGSPASAQTIFNMEPTAEAKSVQIGDNARLYAGSLVFCKRQHLVRIVAYKQAPGVQTALQELASAIEKRLNSM